MAYITADQVIPTYNSKAEDWIAWYNLLPGSKKIRAQLFLSIWKKNGNPKANTVELRNFLAQKAGIELSSTGIGNFFDFSDDLFSSIEDTVQVAWWVFVIFGVSVVGFAGWFIYKGMTDQNSVPGQAIQTGLMFSPQYRAASLTKNALS
jgi:hypothetical protein